MSTVPSTFSYSSAVVHCDPSKCRRRPKRLPTPAAAAGRRRLALLDFAHAARGAGRAGGVSPSSNAPSVGAAMRLKRAKRSPLPLRSRLSHPSTSARRISRALFSGVEPQAEGDVGAAGAWRACSADGRAVLVSVVVAAFCAAVAHALTCNEQHACLKAGTCRKTANATSLGCSFRMSLSAAGARLLNASNGGHGGGGSSRARGVCAPGVQQSVSVHTDASSARRRLFPDALNAEIQLPPAIADAEQAPGTGAGAARGSTRGRRSSSTRPSGPSSTRTT